MCLGVPGKIVAIDGFVATVDFWGVRREVRLEVVDEPVHPGDYILNHVAVYRPARSTRPSLSTRNCCAARTRTT
jgi:hydrogenase assembly chaperone HypC/HupF